MVETIYYKVGFVVCWALIIAISLVICFIIYALLYRLYHCAIGDKYGYYLGKKVKTPVLRNAYLFIDSHPHLKSICLKYRLRNIKRARKWN